MSGLRHRSLSDHEEAIATTLSSRQVALGIAKTALEHKAEDVVVLDLRKLSTSFDFFVIASASSDRRIRTVADAVQEALEQKGVEAHHAEGQREGLWVLLDYASVIAHFFSPEMRKFYDLERLWGDAARVSIPTKRPRAPHVVSHRL